MSVLPYIAAVWLLIIGLYGCATSRNMIHLVGCLFVVQSSTYVLLLSLGYRQGATAPIFQDVPAGTPAVDPVVQALTLTDVVVAAAVSALTLVFAIQGAKRAKTLDHSKIVPMKG
jgi:multicomponent Na+:H+ antiporter subunit C